MKIFDCFMYFDEEIVLDLRFNILDKYVDYFIIVESNFTHKGDKRELNFNQLLWLVPTSLRCFVQTIRSACGQSPWLLDRS